MKNNGGNANSLTLTGHFGEILYAFRLPGKRKEKEKERESATLLSYKPLSKCLSRLGALHLHIYHLQVGCRCDETCDSSCPTMFRG
jgi:hypothetical protein